jgi:hypothetical protein
MLPAKSQIEFKMLAKFNETKPYSDSIRGKTISEKSENEEPDKAEKSFSADSKSKKPHYHGHRDRLREKFRTKGADSLAEYEILELLLFRSIPHSETPVFC